MSVEYVAQGCQSRLPILHQGNSQKEALMFESESGLRNVNDQGVFEQTTNRVSHWQ